MNLKTIALGVANVRSKLHEKVYLRMGMDWTKPVQVYGLVTNRCNLRCKMCGRSTEIRKDMSAADWCEILKDLKEFIGVFNMNFSGGEPLVREDFLEILEFCRKERIITGFTTNGLNLTEDKIKRIIDLDLFNLNISIEGITDAVNDSIRAHPGLLAKVKKHLDLLLAYRQRKQSKLKIILKPVISNLNLHEIDGLAEFAKSKGVLIHFQPVEVWSDDSKKMLEVDPQLLERQINTLVAMKKAKYPIMNSEAALRGLRQHFFPPAESMAPTACVVPLRTLMIESDGDAFLCIKHKAVGNIKKEGIRKLWYQASTRKTRKQLAFCTMKCNSTCYSKKDWKYYIDLFLNLN